MKNVKEVIEVKESIEARIKMLETVATKGKKLNEQDRQVARVMLKEERESLEKFFEMTCHPYTPIVDVEENKTEEVD